MQPPVIPVLTKDVYIEAIRRHVCALCRRMPLDSDACEPDVCRIEKHMDGIVHAVMSVQSRSYDDYLHALRREVCPSCRDNDAEGCMARSDGTCELDVYFPLVIEAIRDVHAAQATTPAS